MQRELLCNCLRLSSARALTCPETAPTLALSAARIGRYDSKQVYTRGERSLLDEIRSEFRDRLEDQPVDFVDVLLVKMTIPDRVQSAIQDKLIHEQEAFAYDFILEQEKREKQRRIIEAQGVKAFSEISEVSAVQWRALETTAALAESNNAKIVIMGNGATSLPLLLNEGFAEATGEEPQAPAPSEQGGR